MQGILDREGEVGICSTRFRQMIDESDGYSVVKRFAFEGRTAIEHVYVA